MDVLDPAAGVVWAATPTAWEAGGYEEPCG